MLVADERLVGARNRDRHDLRLEVTFGDRRRGPLLAAGCELVLLPARDAVALGDVLGGLAHRIALEGVGDEGERPVDQPPLAEPPPVARAVLEERLAAHRLVPAGDDDVSLAGQELLRAADDRLKPRRAEAVDVHRGRPGRDPGGDRAPARVVGVGADLADLAHDDLVHVLRRDVRARERLADARRPELERVDVPQLAAEPADRGADAADEDDRIAVPRHGFDATPQARPEAARRGREPRR